MSSNLKVNTILPSTGTTVAVSGIASVTSSISAGSSITGTTFYGSGANLTSLPAQATIANNADNRVITGGSGVNLNGESGLTWTGSVFQLTSSGGNQFPFNVRNDFTPNSQRCDYGYFANSTSNNALRLGSINSNGGVTIQSTRMNDSAVKHNLSLQPDGGKVVIGTTTPSSNSAAYMLTVADLSNSGGNCGITIRSGNTGGTINQGSIFYSDATSGAGEYAGYLQYDHSTTPEWFRIGVASNPRFYVYGNGNAEITDGDLKLASGHGIDFSATGDTVGGVSELFDDYEEGSFTPTLKNFTGSYTSQIGRYTKVGNIVHYNVFVKINSASGSGVTGINLPFDNASGMTVVGHLVGNEHWDTNLAGTNITTWMPNGSNEARFYKNSGSNLSQINVSDIGSSGEIAIAGSYRV